MDEPILSSEYRSWLLELKRRYRSTQIKSSVAVNRAILEFNWSLGKDISEKYSGVQYGAKFYSKLSADLKLMLPEATGLSKGNIIYCQRFYELYSKASIVPQLAEQSSGADKTTTVPQLVEQFPAKDGIWLGRHGIVPLFLVPWGHHRLIIDKCKGDVKKALFYVLKTVENNWSRNVLLNWISTDLYSRDGKAVTNFQRTLPEPDGDLAQQLTKDPYVFSVQGLSEKYNETQLKAAMVKNIEALLLELGNGFAFVGREKVVEVCGEEKRIDLLFYFIPQHRYCAVEVKTGEFEPSDLGQLQGYVAACDLVLNRQGDCPAMGLLVCKGKNAPLVRYLIGKTDMPLGVSDYELTKVLPANFKDDMPSVEEFEAELERLSQGTPPPMEENNDGGNEK